MNGSGQDTLAERVLVLAPTSKDAEVSREVLASAGILAIVCKTLDEVCREMERGGGAALLTQESILGDRSGCLAATLGRQPPWSDFPLIVLTPAGPESSQARRALEDIGHMTLMKRPVQIDALVSVIRTALRDRGRQYAVRDYIIEREHQSEALRRKDAEFRFALQTAGMGSWEIDLTAGSLSCTDACKAIFGRAADTAFTYQDLFGAIHPDDRERIREATEEAVKARGDYEVEYRVIWPNNSLHWVLARGQAFFTIVGGPLRIVGLALDITERRLQEEALRENDRRKDEFLAMLAHELRNPLAAISAASRVFGASEVTSEDLEWGRGVLVRQIKNLSRLIDDLLDVSRVNSGKIRLRIEDFDAAPVLGSAVEVVRPLIEERHHNLTVSLTPGPLRLHADPTRVEQILVNLLANAAKYTESGGRISITASHEAGQVVFKVQDNGMGIAPEKMPAMFLLFGQGDRTLARSEGGLGIGLTLVKALTELHGGTITANSRGVGLGSEFVVRLPEAPRSSVDRSARTPNVSKVAKGSRVLVVDDNTDAARGLARLLRLLGHEVGVAHSGPEAIEVAQEYSPEVVLLDIGLPGMDGYEVAARLRHEPSCRHAVLIAVTGYGQDQDRLRSEKAGFDHHLVKPVDYDALVMLIDPPGAPR